MCSIDFFCANCERGEKKTNWTARAKFVASEQKIRREMKNAAFKLG